MPRPTKCRKVCHFPQTLVFSPQDAPQEREPVVLTVDEYEAIRLIDWEGCGQEECATFMQIARATVQRIYESARRKLAASLVEGRPLHIAGGEFHLCRGQGSACGRECFKQQYNEEKGDNIMRIAVTFENGEIFQHFGHTEHFKLYDVHDGAIVRTAVVDTNGSGHGALAGVLNALGADVLICGGIGGGAQAALQAAGIRLYGGVSGSADAAVQAFLENRLEFNPDVRCSHHDGHHEAGHGCGEHGCGGHSCGGHGA